jgi:hypothetical protein
MGGDPERHISWNMFFDRVETRTPKIGAMLLLLSSKIETNLILFYSFIYISYYLFSSQK